MSVTFDKSLETGNELIDQQHKELIDRVNKLLEGIYWVQRSGLRSRL